MSSNQWEVVSKSKKQKNLTKKVEAHTEKKRIAALGPKLEEIMPTQQYRSIFTGKLTDSPAKSTSSTKSKSKSPKKQLQTATVATKQHPEFIKSTHQSKSATKHKSLEAALRSITPDDFAVQLEQLKLSFPGSELLWLKGVATYLTINLPFDCDPIFSGKSIHYPSNLVSQPLKHAIITFLNSVGEASVAYFYQTLLISMADELSKNLPIVGYKIMLQLIAQNWPHICSHDMAKTVLLKSSYENRSYICLSILWAIGQGGYQQLSEGVKVWQNLMLPMLELRNYCKFITEYLEKVLNSAVDQSLNITQNNFFITYNALKLNYASIPKEQQESLARSAELFLQKYIASVSKHSNIFLTLFRDIEHSKKNRIELEGCLSCLIRSDDSFKVWKMNYKKQLLPSTLLLQKIAKSLEEGNANALAESKSLSSFLLEAQNLNAELEQAKRRDANLDELIAAVASVQEKSAQQKKKQGAESKKNCGCCKWVLGSILLIALIGGALTYDTQVNGKGVFEKSATGKLLKTYGLLPYVEKAWYTTMSTSARGYKWAEEHVPPYAKPVCELLCDLYKIARNATCNVLGLVRDFVNAKLPVAAQFLEQYLPGLPQKIESLAETVKNISRDIYDNTVWLFKTQVFVGSLSPENLRQCLNDTQNLALEYYNLFHKKVDAYAKLK